MKAKRKRIVPVLMGIALSILPSGSGISQAAAPTTEQAEPHESDACFANYTFRDGETIPQLRIHYVTLGTAHRNNGGEIDNAQSHCHHVRRYLELGVSPRKTVLPVHTVPIEAAVDRIAPQSRLRFARVLFQAGPFWRM